MPGVLNVIAVLVTIILVILLIVLLGLVLKYIKTLTYKISLIMRAAKH